MRSSKTFIVPTFGFGSVRLRVDLAPVNGNIDKFLATSGYHDGVIDAYSQCGCHTRRFGGFVLVVEFDCHLPSYCSFNNTNACFARYRVLGGHTSGVCISHCCGDLWKGSIRSVYVSQTFLTSKTYRDRVFFGEFNGHQGLFVAKILRPYFLIDWLIHILVGLCNNYRLDDLVYWLDVAPSECCYSVVEAEIL